MIISQIIGGLGNQMFQCAAGRALALRISEPYRLDVSGYRAYGLHQGFELQQVFNCPIDTASNRDIHRVLGWQSIAGIRRVIARPAMAMFRRHELVVEPHFNYWPGINDVPSECYLLGYWQSEKYFSDASETIRADFTFRQPLSSQNAELAKKISQTMAVSLHVRRGDYVTNPKSLSTHGLCSLEYYRDAVRFLAGTIECPEFFIFSDDIAWVKANLVIDYPCTYVNHNSGTESYNDMRLMSLCRHHIIANSSFSWWGAWLNPNQDKIVIAPKKWFANDNNVEDLLPEDWVRI